MSLRDLRAEDSSSHEHDLIVIGSGPAGLVLATELMGTGLKVAVLESGGEEADERSNALNDFQSIGQRRAHHDEVRCRGFGGSSAMWTGRCGMLDAIDFHHRPWLPRSGWPIEPRALRQFYHRAGAYLGLAATLDDSQAAQSLFDADDSPPWDTALFSNEVWQYSNGENEGGSLIRQLAAADVTEASGIGILQHSGRTKAVNFAERLRQPLLQSSDIDIFLHATAMEIETRPDGRTARSVLVARPDGTTVRFHARTIILACGGIENARLLLASRSANPKGLGNDADQVGRYLTDHHFTEIGRFEGPKGAMVRRRLGSRWHADADTRTIYQMGIRSSPAIQRERGLLNATIHMTEFGGQPNALSTLASAVRGAKARDKDGFLSSLSSTAKRPRNLLAAANDRLIHHRPPLNSPELTLLGCVVEQELDPDSRVTLSEESNWLGQPMAKLDWRLSDLEYRTAQAVAGDFHAELQRLGHDMPARPDWLTSGQEAWAAQLLDLAHPSCTTRMSDDPASGVVDANCKIHGIDGLYVAGSSVFSTPGHMNPTHTIVSLSIRLADHLKGKIVDNKDATAAQAKPPSRIRIGFIGGGHRVANIYAPIMKALENRFEVAGIATKTAAGADRIAAETGWPAGTDIAALAGQEGIDFLVAALPSASIDETYPGLIDLGLPLFLETPFCWSEIKGRQLLQKIDKAGLLVGVAEQFPFMPEAQLQRKIIELGLIGPVNAVMNDFCAYDYHGIGLLRTLIGRERRAINANGRQARIGDEDWLLGSIGLEDGGLIAHNYSARYRQSDARPAGDIRIYGDRGTIMSDKMIFGDAATAPAGSNVIRNEDAGDLAGLSVETPDGIINWHNPFHGSGLNDEQIAVAELLVRMGDSARYQAPAPYSASSALEDVELLAAMRYSADAGGGSLGLPFSPVTQKVRRKARQVSTRLLRRNRP
ncbi:GMC oxidoreductase [Paracoccus tegillarcae]|uniref:Choline dehydrogenase n=1 Tax=Paracoccus tegillarcae TaxID=1529068 RepID=A0A2K9ERH9_9RHOB|nr:GMC oxidoreductase [Paracoccus tegillarcae]AUH33386.1 hypothetical protein CUV01_08270 [Paracoccus tegillarcae]